MLYFAYAASIEPETMAARAPEADFRFIAHLPQWKMTFSIDRDGGGLPTVFPEEGNNVWGAVFEIPDTQLEVINDAEAAEGRVPLETQAMDREGRRHPVVVHVHREDLNGEYEPVPDYLRKMVAGGRHWKLPAGWVASLEEHLDDF